MSIQQLVDRRAPWLGLWDLQLEPEAEQQQLSAEQEAQQFPRYCVDVRGCLPWAQLAAFPSTLPQQQQPYAVTCKCCRLFTCASLCYASALLHTYHTAFLLFHQYVLPPAAAFPAISAPCRSAWHTYPVLQATC
jgi:hypothetical protein